MTDYPPVSCMCLTYGRPHLLEEAIYSFLKQDYPGIKELIVLNDFDQQTLLFEHPEVVVINVQKRFKTVGEKRNACAALASHDLLFVWDDDDIYLPTRLSFSIRMLDNLKGFFKASNAYVLNNGEISGPNMNLYHSASCFTRSLFDRSHGYPHMGSGQDLELELAMARTLGEKLPAVKVPNADIYYIYRWAGTGSYHLSGFGQDKAGALCGNEKVAKHVARQIELKRIQTGKIILGPRWAQDYPVALKMFANGTPV